MQTISGILRKTRPAALVALLTATAAVPALADSNYEALGSSRGNSATHLAADGQLVDVMIRVEGSNAPLYFKRGTWDRHYFQALKGRNYSLAVRNNTGRRVGVLIAVDGLNVVNGEQTRLSHDEPMYVLDPWEESVIAGWRTSMHEVRKFVFVDEERSYAERTGQANQDMGWIRVMSFRENSPVAIWDRFRNKERNEAGRLDDAPSVDRSREGAKKSSPPMAPESNMAPQSEGRAQLEGSRDESGNPGTGWGQSQSDPVRRTEFRAERRATDQIVMRYEYESGLRALGIFPRRMRTWDREQGQFGFAQPPRR